MMLVLSLSPLFLSACANMPAFQQGNTGMVTTTDGKVFARNEIGLLEYANYLDEMAATSLKHEVSLVNQEYESKSDAYNTLRLAVVLTRPAASVAENQKAEQLVSRYLKASGKKSGLLTAGNQGYEAIAEYMLRNIQRRKKMLADTFSLQQKIEQLMFIESELNQPKSALPD